MNLGEMAFPLTRQEILHARERAAIRMRDRSSTIFRDPIKTVIPSNTNKKPCDTTVMYNLDQLFE